MPKINDLSKTDLGEVVVEIKKTFPELYQIILGVMLPPDKIDDAESEADVIPKLALIYGILMQTRCHELSHIQCVIGMVLAEYL